MRPALIVLLMLLLVPRSVSAQVTELVMGSWRTEDVAQMSVLLEQFHQQHPDIRVVYDPTTNTEYDAALRAQLQGGTGPDIMLLRSFSMSQSLFEDGFLAPLSDLPGLRDHFSPAALHPWSSDDIVYAVPMIATSHAIYYNRDLFIRLGLAVPRTWEELLRTAEVIRAAGYIPFANTCGDGWTINELVLCSIAPNFLGGVTGRRAYLDGARCFNDPNMVRLFRAVAELAPYLPPSQRCLTYQDSLHLFAQGRAAMWFGGSWDITFLENNAGFAWSVFAPPPLAGQPPRLTFHYDAGVGLNAASPHPDAARLLLQWLVTPEYGRLMGDVLPGFFPLHADAPTLRNAHAAEFLALNTGRETDIRFTWERLRDGTPSGYDLAGQAAVDVLNGRCTPQAAANRLQHGLAAWYAPAMLCRDR